MNRQKGQHWKPTELRTFSPFLDHSAGDDFELSSQLGLQPRLCPTDLRRSLNYTRSNRFMVWDNRDYTLPFKGTTNCLFQGLHPHRQLSRNGSAPFCIPGSPQLQAVQDNQGGFNLQRRTNNQAIAGTLFMTIKVSSIFKGKHNRHLLAPFRG